MCHVPVYFRKLYTISRFAFVEYESHRSAAMARRKLMNGRVQLWGHHIAVDWAEPELEVDEEIMAQVKGVRRDDGRGDGEGWKRTVNR